MTKLVLNFLAFEITRRCNIKCGHCMRGDAQNINISKEYINNFFNTSNNHFIFKLIDNICFTGGEPTLYPEIIIYTINKIIDENIPVKNISMATNGQLFIPELVKAFNKFNEYSNLRLLKDINQNQFYSEQLQKLLIESIKDNHVKIIFSTDDFHAPISKEIKESYYSLAKGLKIFEHTVANENILKSGYSKVGKEVKPCEGKYDIDENNIYFYELLYLTAKGDLLFGGEANYDFIDSHTIGKVGNDSIVKLIKKYGNCIS